MEIGSVRSDCRWGNENGGNRKGFDFQQLDFSSPMEDQDQGKWQKEECDYGEIIQKERRICN